MTSTFSFGFSGDDIDEEVVDENQASVLPDHLDGLNGAGLTSSEPKQIESERYGLEGWVSLRPLSFSVSIDYSPKISCRLSSRCL